MIQRSGAAIVAIVACLAALPSGAEDAASAAATPAEKPTDSGVSVAEAESGADATPVIERLNASLLELMQHSEELGYEGRARQIEPVVRESFDLQTISRVALGRRWSTLEPEQREGFVELLTGLTVASYAGRFGGYSGERFEILGEEAAPRSGRLVRSRIVRPGEEPVALDYRLHRRDGSWRIIDVLLGASVSELALRRSEYSAVLRESGYDELVSRLEARIIALHDGAP
jgi:phospholipid transport system substrate-binding protein